MTHIAPPEVQCHGKRCYRTKAAAKRAARSAERTFGRMRAYRCPHCGGFHVGHKPATARRAAKS